MEPRKSKIRGGYLRCGSIYSREPSLILDYRCDPDNLSIKIMYLITSFAKIIADCDPDKYGNSEHHLPNYGRLSTINGATSSVKKKNKGTTSSSPNMEQLFQLFIKLVLAFLVIMFITMPLAMGSRAGIDHCPCPAIPDCCLAK